MQIKVDIKDLIPFWDVKYTTKEEEEAIKKLGDYIIRLQECGFYENTGKPTVLFKREGDYLVINIEQKRIAEKIS